MQNYVKTSQCFTNKEPASLFKVQEKLRTCESVKKSFPNNYFISNERFLKVYAHIQ